jgi:hypothetical protein
MMIGFRACACEQFSFILFIELMDTDHFSTPFCGSLVLAQA